mmetsp:Transcript_68901/g.121785  ORF Transcript_68901/g.121785 Transcript_68901/m.121785 type:complete len:132 (+) Transcript_68901:68-463(+)
MAKSTALLRVAALGLIALALKQLVFVVAPTGSKLRGYEAAVAGAVMAAPMPALATDGQPLDGWGAQELAAVFIPFAFICTLFFEWEGKQDDADLITGVGALGRTIDGPTPDKPAYFRRSPYSPNGRSGGSS